MSAQALVFLHVFPKNMLSNKILKSAIIMQNKIQKWKVKNEINAGSKI